MELGELVSFYRRRAGLTIDELAEKSGVPKSTINKIIGGVTKAPTLENVKSIARALGVKLADFDDEPQLPDLFSPSEQDHIKKYRVLDEHGKEMVDSALTIEYKRYLETEAKKRPPEPPSEAADMEASEEIEPVAYSVPRYSLPMSAGTGVEAGQEEPDDFTLVKRPPRGTSFIAPVSGNSMEPTYFNDQLVFIHATTEISVGKVGVFLMDGQQWIKELGDGVLISHNPEYPPRAMTDDIRCQGLVLGVCDESYFE